jgi:hypothetical protein
MFFLLIGGHRHAVPVPGVSSRRQQLGRDIQHTIRITQQGTVQGFNVEKSDLRFKGRKPVFVKRDKGVLMIDLSGKSKLYFTAHGINGVPLRIGP